MKRYDDILRLADRFLDGCTSLAEERELERFFADHKADIPSMPEHLQALAEMFEGFAVAAPAPAKRPAWHRWRWTTAAAATAACITAILAINFWVSKEDASPIAEAIPVLKINIKQQSLQSLETTDAEQQAVASLYAEAQSVTTVTESTPQETKPTPTPLLMVRDDGLQTLVAECELALLEEKFQKYKASTTYVKI